MSVNTPEDQRRERARPRALVARVEAAPGRRIALVALVLYALCATRVYWPQWPLSSHSIVGCACGDEMQEVWFLQWTPWSLVHGLSPLFTNWMDYPRGVNLVANTTMPLLALVAAPVTWLAGAVASYNLLMWVSFPLSAFAAYWVLRRLLGSNLAALLGGLLYGFSPYMIGQGVSHLFLVFVPLPPLIFYCLYQIVVHQVGSARRWGLWLGAATIAQALISEEVAADTALVAACALLVALVTWPREVTRARLGYAARAAAYALASVLVVMAYPVYVQFFGPQHYHGAAHATVRSTLKLDLLGTVVPNVNLAVAPHWLTRLGNQFMGGDVGEDGGYLGLPLVVALGVIVLTLRRQRAVRYLAALAVVIEVLAMGRWLTVANHTTTVPLPWTWVSDLPTLENILPSRFALFASFAVALLVGLGVREWIAWAGARHHRGARVGVNLALGALAVASLVVYQGRTPIPTVPTPTIPSFFTTTEQLAIPANSVVLTFPFTVSPNATSLYWQVRTDFRWRMIGGEAIVPTRRGRASGYPIGDPPLPVDQFLTYWSGGTSRLPVMGPRLVAQLRSFLARNNVGTVVLDPSAAHAAAVLTLFAATMGPPRREGGVDVWWHARTRADAWLARHPATSLVHG